MKRRFLRPTPTSMRIGGESVPRELARIVYRCSQCLGELVYHNAGLACKADKTHRFFIHRDDATELQALRDSRAATVEAAYIVIDGLLKPRKEVIQ